MCSNCQFLFKAVDQIARSLCNCNLLACLAWLQLAGGSTAAPAFWPSPTSSSSTSDYGQEFYFMFFSFAVQHGVCVISCHMLRQLIICSRLSDKRPQLPLIARASAANCCTPLCRVAERRERGGVATTQLNCCTATGSQARSCIIDRCQSSPISALPAKICHVFPLPFRFACLPHPQVGRGAGGSRTAVANFVFIF